MPVRYTLSNNTFPTNIQKVPAKDEHNGNIYDRDRRHEQEKQQDKDRVQEEGNEEQRARRRQRRHGGTAPRPIEKSVSPPPSSETFNIHDRGDEGVYTSWGDRNPSKTPLRLEPTVPLFSSTSANTMNTASTSMISPTFASSASGALSRPRPKPVSRDASASASAAVTAHTNGRAIPRDTAKAFVPAFDPKTDLSTRFDSVFDAYAEMYNDTDDEEDEEQVGEIHRGIINDQLHHHGDELDEHHHDQDEGDDSDTSSLDDMIPPTPTPHLSHFPTNSEVLHHKQRDAVDDDGNNDEDDDDEEDDIDIEDEDEGSQAATEPWDQRGKNGLYGGGGRGADDRETGWVGVTRTGEMATSLRKQDRVEAEEDGEDDLYASYGGATESNENEGDEVNQHPIGSPSQCYPVYTLQEPRIYPSRLSQVRPPPLASHRRHSSSLTENSSYGPVTPSSANFSASTRGWQGGSADSGYRSNPSPPTDAKDQGMRFKEIRHEPQKTTPRKLSREVPKYILGAPGLPVSALIRPPNLRKKSSSSFGKKEHSSGADSKGTVLESHNRLLKMKISSPFEANAKPPISAPKNQPVIAPSIATYDLKPILSTPSPPPAATDMKRRKSAFSMWTSRGKKSPGISAPILPSGFVESLGMETFNITPGVGVPHATLKPLYNTTSTMTRDEKLNMLQAIAQQQELLGSAASLGIPSQLQGPAKITKDSHPRPQHIPGSSATTNRLMKPQHALQSPIQLQESDRLSLAESERIGELRRPYELFRQASVRTATDDMQQDINEAFKRLEMRDSIASYASPDPRADSTHRQFFNGIREERSKQTTEVQANRGRFNSRVGGEKAVPLPVAPVLDDSALPGSMWPSGNQNRRGRKEELKSSSLSTRSSGRDTTGRHSTMTSTTIDPESYSHQSSTPKQDWHSAITELKPALEEEPYSDDDVERTRRNQRTDSASSTYSLSDSDPTSGHERANSTGRKTYSRHAYKARPQAHVPTGETAPLNFPPDLLNQRRGSNGGPLSDKVVWGSQEEIPPLPSPAPIGSTGFRNPFQASKGEEVTVGGWHPAWN